MLILFIVKFGFINMNFDLYLRISSSKTLFSQHFIKLNYIIGAKSIIYTKLA